MDDNRTQRGEPGEDLLCQAKDQYRRIRQVLEDSQTRINSDTVMDAKRVSDALRDHWKAVHLVRSLEKDIEDEKRKRDGIVNEYGLDLDTARFEVWRRLSCLQGSDGD